MIEISSARFSPMRGASLGIDFPFGSFDWAFSGARTIEEGGGGFDWGSLLERGITAGTEIYSRRQAEEAAEELRRAAEARAEAERLRAQAAASAEAAAKPPGQLLPGVSNTTLLLAGGGAVALALLVAVIA